MNFYDLVCGKMGFHKITFKNSLLMEIQEEDDIY